MFRFVWFSLRKLSPRFCIGQNSVCIGSEKLTEKRSTIYLSEKINSFDSNLNRNGFPQVKVDSQIKLKLSLFTERVQHQI